MSIIGFIKFSILPRGNKVGKRVSFDLRSK